MLIEPVLDVGIYGVKITPKTIASYLLYTCNARLTVRIFKIYVVGLF